MSRRMTEQRLKSYTVSSEIEEMQALREMKGINTPGQALERGGVASFSAPRGRVSYLAFPALAR